VCAFATSNPYPLLPNHQSDIDRIWMVWCKLLMCFSRHLSSFLNNCLLLSMFISLLLAET
jgi:hypothetical protein